MNVKMGDYETQETEKPNYLCVETYGNEVFKKCVYASDILRKSGEERYS